jgi:hypothetical protein
MRSLLVLAALVHRVEALMLMCTPRSANAFVVLMQAQSDSAQPISMSRFADMADKALAGKDQALAAMDELLAAKDELIDLHRLRTPQNHPLLGRPRVTLSCLSRAYLVRVAFAETYQKDLKLSKHVAFLHARSVVELTAAIFCRNDAKIKTHSGMVNKFLNGECAAPHACAPYAAASIAAARPPPCPINLLCSLLSSLSHPAGLQDRHPDADGGRRRHARDAG